MISSLGDPMLNALNFVKINLKLCEMYLICACNAAYLLVVSTHDGIMLNI